MAKWLEQSWEPGWDGSDGIDPSRQLQVVLWDDADPSVKTFKWWVGPLVQCPGVPGALIGPPILMSIADDQDWTDLGITLSDERPTLPASCQMIL